MYADMLNMLQAAQNLSVPVLVTSAFRPMLHLGNFCAYYKIIFTDSSLSAGLCPRDGDVPGRSKAGAS